MYIVIVIVIVIVGGGLISLSMAVEPVGG